MYTHSSDYVTEFVDFNSTNTSVGVFFKSFEHLILIFLTKSNKLCLSEELAIKIFDLVF